MPPSTRIPPLLQPVVELPREDSVLLVTSTLGASANWLLIRYLCDALSTPTTRDVVEQSGHNVVLASWMRDYEFWRQESRKSGGLDLERLKKEGRFAFVDGLSESCLRKPQPPAQGNATPPARPIQTQTLPARGPPGRSIPARGPPIQSPPATPSATTIPNPAPTPGHHTLKSLDLTHIKSTITAAISSLSTTASRHTLILLDCPDLLLTLSSTLTPSQLSSTVHTLHALPTVSHVLTHLHADTPLLSLSTPAQPLEIAQHNFLVKVAHAARRIVGVRVLDTGVARDVSGVVRVSERGVGWGDVGFEKDGKEESEGNADGAGREFLYQVKGDGSVRVFERGAGGEA